MNCDEFSGLVEDFREDLLEDNVRSGVLDHLAECTHCRGKLARLDAVDSGLKEAMGGLSPSRGFAERVSAVAWAQMPRPETTGNHFSRWFPALAAAGILFVGGVFWAISFRGRQSEAAAGAKAVPVGLFEPSSEQVFAIGPAYVVRNGKVEACSYEAPIRVVRIKKGVPELVVDAFPMGESI